MKKHIGLIIFALIVIILIVVAVVFSESESKYIKEINVNEALEKVNNDETFMLYIKQTDCEHCKDFNPTFLKVLREYKLTSYALNISNLKEEDKKVYEENFKVEGTPTVYFYQEGNKSLITIEGAISKDKIISKLEATNFIK